MKKVKAVIERASDGKFSIYMDADGMDYLITGTGNTVSLFFAAICLCFFFGWS